MMHHPIHILAADIGLACAPLLGFIGYNVAKESDIPPTLVGLAMLVISAFAVPVVRWMMKKIDGDARRRDRREDALQDAFIEQLTTQVTALTSVAANLGAIAQHLGTILARLDSKP